MKSMRRSLIVLSLLITIGITASGQVTRGSLTGLVNDSTGAMVANAKVVIKNDATSVELSATTNGQGSFVFPSLDPGKYTVIVESNGFKRAEVKDVVIQVSTPATISVILEVGQVSEAVVVSGETQEVINTTSPTLTNVINTRQVQDLPIAGRNPMDLARLQAGIAVNGTNTRTASVGGLRGSATNIEQDGINAMDNYVKTDSFFALTAPSLNSTSEFSVTVGTVGSDAGRGVAQVRLVTPSGSNQIHGAAFWEHHNDFLNANTFFNNLNNTPRTIIRQNYFGGSLSGPIFLPRFGQGGKAFIDERNKGFWFFSYEGFREPFSVTRNRTVLTAAARQGQFSYVGSNGQTQTVDLLSIGNAHSLNPITMAKLNAMPASNNTLVGDGLNTAGFQYNVPGKDPNNKYNFRIDQNLFESQKWGSHKLEVDYHRGSFLISPDTFNSNEAPFPGNTNAIQSSIRTLAAAAIQSTFGSNITNEVRFGHQRAPVGFLREAAPTDPFFITFQSGVTNYDLQFMSQGRNTIVYQFLDNFSLVKGTHTFRTGFDFQSVSAITFNDAGLEPTVTLGTNSANSDGIVKGDFPLLPSGSTGDAIVTRARNVFADITGFLGSASRTLNIVSPDSGFVPGATRSRDFKQREFSLYFQDQWKIKRNFTFNYGTRWEYEGVPYEIHGLAIQPSNGIDGLYGISGPGNLFNPGVLNGQPTTSLDFVNGKTGKKLYNNDWNNFAPFVGLAYSPNFEKGPMKYIFGKDGKSSIRAGYSISYLHDGFTVVSNALGTGTTNPGLIQTAANTTPVGVLTGAGVPLTIAPFQIPITDQANLSQNSANGLWTFDPNLRTPYVQQWSFGIEREIAKDTALEVRYVGNHAIKVYRAININEVNVYENGFLNEFLGAQNNLAIFTAANPKCGGANQPACSFGNSGLPGQVSLPAMSTLFNGISSDSGFTSTTFISNLNNNNIGAMANTLAFSPTYAATRANLTVNGRLAPNFFVANPNAAFAQALTNGSFSNYNSLQIEFRRRLSRGLYFQANYTFSKAITDSEGSQSTLESYRTIRDIDIDRHRANFDQTHRFIANYIYELPFGTGRRWLNSGFAPLRKAIEGWQFGGIVTLQSGLPFTIYSNRTTVNQSNPGLNPAQLTGISFSDFANSVGLFKTPTGVFFIDPKLLTTTLNPKTGLVQSSTLNPGLISAPAPGTFGDFPRNILTGPGFTQVDFTLVKRTHITEQVQLEFRATFLNAFNHANFNFGDATQSATAAAAQTTFDSTTFGRITSTTANGTPRNIFFALGLNF